MFVLRCVVLMMNFSGRPATLTIPFASNRTGRTFRASMSWDAPMSGLIVRCSVRTCLWAYGRWVNMNGSLQHLMAIAYIYIAFKWQLGLCQWVCLLHSGVPKIIKESDLMVEAASHTFSKAPAKPSHQNPTWRAFQIISHGWTVPHAAMTATWMQMASCHCKQSTVLALLYKLTSASQFLSAFDTKATPSDSGNCPRKNQRDWRVMKCKRSIEIHGA